jgi:MFS family permease
MELNVAAGFLGMMWLAAAAGLPLPLLMESVKASGFQLGLLSGVRQFAMLAQLPSAFLVERLLRRKPYWATAALIHRAIWMVPALLPVVLPHRRDLWPVIIIVSLGVSEVLGNAGTAPWFSWMADLVPPHRAGRFWGARQRVLSIGLLVSAFIYGLVLDEFSGRAWIGYQIVFTAAALFGMADILLHLHVHEPAPVRAQVNTDFWRRIRAPLADRDFRRMTLAMGFWAAAVAMPGYFMGLPSFFSMVYLKEAFGSSYGQASWIFIASALGAILWTPRIGRWMDRHGARRTLMGLMAVGPFFTLAWLFVSPRRFSFFGWLEAPQPILLLSLASLGVGGAYAGVTLCQVRLTQVFTGQAGRTVAMAVHWSLVGLIGTCGALGAGWIKDHLGRSGAPLLEGWHGSSYFQILVLIHVALAWGVALPLVGRIAEPHPER